MQSASCNLNRPQRLIARDFAGRNITLAQDQPSWETINEWDGDLLLLGLGPGDVLELPQVRAARAAHKKIYWLEETNTLQFYMEQKQHVNLDQLLHVEQAEALRLAKSCKIMFYKPGLRLAPDFWGPILANLRLADFPLSSSHKTKFAWLPGHKMQLLHGELHEALLTRGYAQICTNLPEKPVLQQLEKIWQGIKPDLILSVNFRGLDPEGTVFHLCRALNIPLAVWLVDNPWHLLSGIRLPWWKQAALFVSDSSFIQPLQQSGAQHVFYCPLAASGHMWRNINQGSSKSIFVGRSAFPEHDSFFRGISLASDLLAEAETLLHTKQQPDFHWWQRKLAVQGWPGNAIRKAGYGADLCSLQNRASWLKEAAHTGLQIIGDSGWQKFFPKEALAAPVDYYGSLPDVYNQASAVLNVTSFLLPGSLNQRHFDVWAAGGLLLTDVTRGLDIFPAGLVRPIILETPQEWRQKLEFFNNDPARRRDLIHAWQEEIADRHTYAHRIAQMEVALQKL